MPVTVTVAQYQGQDALRIEGASVLLKDGTDYGFANPTAYTVGSATISVGEEYNIERISRREGGPDSISSIPAVRVDSESDLSTVHDADSGYVWVLPV